MARRVNVALVTLAALLLATPALVAAADADSDGIDDASDNCPNLCSDEIPARVSSTSALYDSCSERYPGSTEWSGYLALRDYFPADTAGLSGQDLSISNPCTACNGFTLLPQPGEFDSSTGYGSVGGAGLMHITLEFTEGPEVVTSVTAGTYEHSGWSAAYVSQKAVEYLDASGTWQPLYTTPTFAAFTSDTYTLPTPVTTTSIRIHNSESTWMGVGTFMAHSAGRCAAQGGNPDQSDLDGDGIGDLCDDYWFSAANSPTDTSVYDMDSNGQCDQDDASFLCIGNAASGDTDGDGVCDDIDVCPNDVGACDPPAAPTCDDGIQNGDEDCVDYGGSCPTVSFLPSLGMWVSTASDGNNPVATVRGVVYYHYSNAGDAQVAHLGCAA